MNNAKDKFLSNPANCTDHKDVIVYRTFEGREEVHQCPGCGWGYIYNTETGQNY